MVDNSLDLDKVKAALLVGKGSIREVQLFGRLCSISYGSCCLIARRQCKGSYKSVLWDTAASLSLILEWVLPYSNEFAIVSDVAFNDFGMKDIVVPLHIVSVE